MEQPYSMIKNKITIILIISIIIIITAIEMIITTIIIIESLGWVKCGVIFRPYPQRPIKNATLKDTSAVRPAGFMTQDFDGTA